MIGLSITKTDKKMGTITENAFMTKDQAFMIKEVSSQNGCKGCYFAASNETSNVIKESLKWRAMMCEKYACTPISRADKRNVIFKKIKVE